MLKEIVEHSKTIEDPEHLRAIITELSSYAALQKKKNIVIQKIIDDQELAKQQFLSNELNTHLHRLKKVAFGFGREKNKLRDRNRMKEQRQLTLQSKGLVNAKEVVGKKDLPETFVKHLLTEDEMLGHCQDAGLIINEGDEVECEQIKDFYEESREITVTERTYKQLVHKRIKYRAINKTTNQEKIVTAPGPAKVYPKCQFSLGFAVEVVGNKFLNALPYERQRRELKRAGLNVPVSSYCRLERGLSVHLEAVAENIRKDILTTNHLAVGLDETRWPILCKNTTNGYFWIVCNQSGSYYRYEPNRSGAVAKELLKDFEGSLISDKFSGYVQFMDHEKINWGLCLAHARRDFISLQDEYPKECGEILNIMDAVFKVEHEAKSWDELKELRRKESKVLMLKLKGVLDLRLKEFFPKSSMREAINYVLSNWKEFMAFTDDIKLPVSNNESERALRQAVLGRKNYRGSKTIDAADQAAVLFTIIESCKKNELDPKDYIEYVVENNNKGLESLTPLKLAIKKYGKSEFWPESGKLII